MTNRWFLVSVALTALTFGLSGYVYANYYDQLPDRVPIHWNINFEPDGWTNKQNITTTFFLMPCIMTGLVGLSLLLPWLSPNNYKIDSFRDVYFYVFMLVVGLLGGIHAAILLGSLGNHEIMGRLLPAVMCLFFGLIGNVLGRVKRNFWMGVRTPWTLASEPVWVGTHRLAAWLFVSAGVVGFAGSLLGMPGWICFVLVMVAALTPVFYSLYLYKRLEKAGRLGSNDAA